MNEANAAAHAWPVEHGADPCPAAGSVIPLHTATASDEVVAVLTLAAAADTALLERLERLPRQLPAAQVLEVLVAADGARILMRCRGAAAAPVRAALTRLAPTARVWTGIGIDLRLPHAEAADATSRPIVVVEDTGPLGPGLRRLFPYDRLAPELLCLGVTPLRVVLSPDGGRLLACYRAPGIESVRQAQRAGLVCTGEVWLLS